MFDEHQSTFFLIYYHIPLCCPVIYGVNSFTNLLFITYNHEIICEQRGKASCEIASSRI
jgi:hypothetical protein